MNRCSRILTSSLRVLLLFALLVALVSTAQAQEGALDASFAGDGRQTTDLNGSFDNRAHFGIQDGRILLAGRADKDGGGVATRNVAPARYTSDEQSTCDGLAVTTIDDSGPGSLRQALLNANADPDLSTICFAVDGEGPHTITPQSSLPEITEPVVIDGYTQPGASENTQEVGHDAVLMIELVGSAAGDGVHGLSLTAGGSTVRGLAIGGFDGELVDIRNGNENVIEGNFMGTDPSGTQPREGNSGIWIENSADNLIGGTTPAARNLVSGDLGGGIFISGDAADGNQILNNYIGLNPAGTAAVGGNGGGIFVLGADDTVIGAPGAGNVISGDDGGRIFVIAEDGPAMDTIIQGNYLGTNAAGDAVIEAGEEGVFILGAPNTLVGGTEDGAGNVIAGHSGGGLHISDEHAAGTTYGSDGTVVQGNLIGTDATGTQAFGNCCGIEASSENVLIGGTDPGARNVVSGNTSDGIGVGDNSVVQGNYVGVDITGTQPLGNGAIGIYAGSSSLIGGTEPGAGNVIANTGETGTEGDGIWLMGSTAQNTVVQGNLIGTDATGTQPMGNSGDGILIGSGAAGNVIGGAEPGAGNVIAFNTNEGVSVGSNAGTGNALLGNAIYANGGLGIDLEGDGVTENDPGDDDGGTNNLQNFPEVQSADYDEGGGEITLTYLVDTEPAHAAYPLRIEFFRVDEDGQEGAAFLGSDSYTEADFADGPEQTVGFTPQEAVTRSDFIVATATDDDGNTSEFSAQAQPLPVELAAFEATVDEEAVVLTWATASEADNAGFAIEHAPPVASQRAATTSWERLVFVEGAGTTSEPQSYRYRTEALDVGPHRFRLKQIDTDGTFEYSGEVEVDLTLTEAYRVGEVYPNPARGSATLELAVRQAQPVAVTLYDLLGRRVRVAYEGELAAHRTHRIAIEGRHLPSGLYLVRLAGERFTATRRLTIVR